MKRSKKRWAWTAKHKRPFLKGYGDRPDNASWYTGWMQSRHRTQTRRAMTQLRQGAEEADIIFPFHHKHWLNCLW
jgi:hypothetical protein